MRFLPFPAALLALGAAACGGSLVPTPPALDPCAAVACGAHATCLGGGCVCNPGFAGPACTPSTAPAVGGCALFPADHVFNTPIDGLPVHTRSAAFLARIGDRAVHLDLGQDVNPSSSSYYGIPYNVVRSTTSGWSAVSFEAGAYRDESDCAIASSTGHAIVSPCTSPASPTPLFPLPAAPLVEGGSSAAPGDRHMLVVDADGCRLWELYHATPRAGGGWAIMAAATWDLSSNALRPDSWTSTDAAGFPILPLLLRADEASSGEIRHALRFTVPSTHSSYLWPARHQAGSSSPADLPPMGLLLRLKASYLIPPTYSTQAKAMLGALKRYGMYLADNGSAIYVQGEPSAAWGDAVFGELGALRTADFEAVDLSSLAGRPGFDADSARVPPP